MCFYFQKRFKANKGALMSSQFQKLHEVCEKDWRKVDHKDTTVDPDNCRFPEIISAGSSLVRLYPDLLTQNVTITTNAVYMDASQKKEKFIVSQVPLEHTSGHFWCMVKQNKIEQIFILNEPGDNEVGTIFFTLVRDTKMVYFLG